MLNNDDEIAKLQVLLNNLKNKQTSNVDETTPLLKKNNRPVVITESKPIQEVATFQEIKKEKPVKEKKPRPPKTDKQLEAFRKVQERRAEEIERKKQAQIYASAKLLLEKNNINIETSRSKPSVPSVPTQNNPIKKQKQLKEESSDEEVYVVQSKKKKNVKKRIILESSDDESSDDEQVQINRQPTYRDTSNFFV